MKVKASFRGIEIETDVEPVNDGYFDLDFDGMYLMEIFTTVKNLRLRAE